MYKNDDIPHHSEGQPRYEEGGSERQEGPGPVQVDHWWEEILQKPEKSIRLQLPLVQKFVIYVCTLYFK